MGNPNPRIDAVVAGSKSFALALFAPLTERVGVRPRITSDAAHVAALLPVEGGLAIVEYAGDETFRAIEALLRTPGVRVVAAVPPPHAAAEERLRALGADAAQWDGAPAGVLGAIARQLAPAATPTSAPGAAAAKASRAPGAGIAPPSRAPAAPAPRTSVASPPRSNVASPVAPRPNVAAAVPASKPPAPMFVSAAAPASAATLERLSAPTPPAAGPAQPVAWPFGGAASAQDLEDALARGLAGLFDVESPLRAVTEQVVQGLSPLERAILSGETVPVDADVVRRAALMRLRVAAALAAAPAAGSPVDGAGVSAILAEIDGLLSEVGALVQSATPELHGSLEAVRNALVKEAIDFSEAAQRLAPDGKVVAPGARLAPARTRVLSVERGEAHGTRTARWQIAVLVVVALAAGAYHAVRYLDRPLPATARTLVGAPSGSSAVIVPPTAGAPPPPIVLRSVDDKPFDGEQVRTFTEDERAKGNAVFEMSPGFMLVVPGGASPAAGK